MADLGNDAYGIWYEFNAKLNDYPGIRDLLFLLAQERCHDGAFCHRGGRAFDVIRDEELDVHLICIRDALEDPSKASLKFLTETDVRSQKLTDLAVLKRFGGDQGALQTLIAQRQVAEGLA